MVFRSTILAAVFLFLLITLSMGLYVVWVTPEDVHTYHTLVDGGQTPNPDYTTKQERRGISKTLLLTEGGKRKKATLSSRSSQLLYAKVHGKGELMEKMHDVQLVYQEKLLKEDKQIVVKITADTADYFYQQEKLSAENAQIKRYLLPGHEMPLHFNVKPFFQGTSARIEMTLSGENPTFSAQKLKSKVE